MNEERFWIEGQRFIRHNNLGMRQFREFFGTTPAICAIIWNLLAQKEKLPNKSKPMYLLFALLLLKLYGTEELIAVVSGVDNKTFRKWSWIFINLLAFELDVINFESRFEGAFPNAWCFVSLDATDCPIQEPSPFSSKWFSHKLNGAGVKYEIGVNIQTGLIVWVFGGLPCGKYSDLKLARQRYIHAVDIGERTIADDTYKDSNYFIYPTAPDTTTESGRLQKKIMARHETVNRRLKIYSVLTTKYRHDIDSHRSCFYAVANVTQLMLLHDQPLYKLNDDIF